MDSTKYETQPKTKYRQLCKAYAMKNGAMSCLVKNQEYYDLLAMGKDIIPLLLADLASEDSGSPLSSTPPYGRDYSVHGHFSLLRELTGITPPKFRIPEDSGKVNKLRLAWIDWGWSMGYLPAKTSKNIVETPLLKHDPNQELPEEWGPPLLVAILIFMVIFPLVVQYLPPPMIQHLELLFR